jgi:hypothetical protein
MFGKKTVNELITRSAENPEDRRRFLQSAGAVGLGVAGLSVLPSFGGVASASAPSDAAILNFALNLEYLEAEFYSHAVHGHGIPEKLTHGTGNRGPVVGGHKVPFRSAKIRQYAKEIARDELDHVSFLRSALGSAAVSRPKVDLVNSFTAAARAAGIVKPHEKFNPYANENNFLLAAFLFEDVGVTAYKGAAPLIQNKTYLGAAAGILAVEAYHAATIRTSLYNKGLDGKAGKLSNARDALDGKKKDDQGIRRHHRADITPTNSAGVAFGRSYDRVLNIVYLNPKKVHKGGFFPTGVNGSLHTSG